MTATPQRGTPLVAIVDDEVDIVTFLRLALEDAGFTVVGTTDPRAAMAMLEEAVPDLICLDLLMPGQMGVSLYAEIAGHRVLGDLPIVILSGLAGRDELPALLHRSGCLPASVRFLEKPVDLEEFLSTVATLLGQSVGDSP